MSVDVSVRVSVRGSTMKLRVTLTKPPMGNVIWKRTIAWISFWYDKTIFFFSCSSFVLGVYAGATFPFSLCECYYRYYRRKNKKKNRGFGREHIVTLERGGNRCELYLDPFSILLWTILSFFMLSSFFFLQKIIRHEIDCYLIKAWLVNQMKDKNKK
jgi:hypothetical protein